jgi:hypothetical protein
MLFAESTQLDARVEDGIQPYVCFFISKATELIFINFVGVI